MEPGTSLLTLIFSLMGIAACWILIVLVIHWILDSVYEHKRREINKRYNEQDDEEEEKQKWKNLEK